MSLKNTSVLVIDDDPDVLIAVRLLLKNEVIYWLKRIKELNNTVSVIMITAYGDIDLAVRSLKEGAADFILKPWHNEKLTEVIKELLDKKDSDKQPKTTSAKSSGTSTTLLGDSEVMQDIF